MADSVELIAESSDEEMRAKTHAKIEELLRELLERPCDGIVVTVVSGERVLHRWVGAPYVVFHLAQMLHERIMDTFALDATAPLPGTKLN